MSYGRQLLLGPASAPRIAGMLPPGDPTIMQKLQMMLGNLGNRIDKADRAYADAIYERLGGAGNQHKFVEQTATAPIKDLLMGSPGDGFMNQVVHYGRLGGNIASRYALPAGGVTLAGKGLLDIASALGGSDEDE